MTRLEGVPSDIALLAGPLYLGSLFGYGLYGILIVQIFMYYHRFQKDPLWMKALVWVLFFVETLVTVLSTIAGWKFLASGWGDLAVLAPLDWAFAGIPFLSGLVASSVHVFYCWRIYKLRKLVVIPIVLATISLVAFGMAALSGIRGRQLGLSKLNQLKPWVTVWLGGSTLVDILITICMVTILFQAHSRTLFEETSSVIQKLITLTIETAMVTGVTALTELILFLVFPNNNLHFLLFLMLAKLYSNTLLATLNARAFLGQQDTVAAPALWNDDSIDSSQRIINNRRVFFMSPRQSSLSTTIQDSQRSDYVELEAPVFANRSQLSLAKKPTTPPSSAGGDHSEALRTIVR